MARSKADKALSRASSKPSITDPNDPDAVAAFETSAGIPSATKPRKPVMVNKFALANFNAQVDPEVQRNQIEAANVAALFARRAIRPDEIAALRRRMLEITTTGVEDVAQVLAGTKQWNSVQVRLFSLLMERVMPKLSTIAVEDPHRKIEDLTIEELEAIALGKKNHLAVDTVVKQAKAAEGEDKKADARADRKLTGSLIKISSIDQAEKKYTAKKLAPEVSVPKKESSTTTPKRPTSPRE